jgi:hypothetical protein
MERLLGIVIDPEVVQMGSKPIGIETRSVYDRGRLRSYGQLFHNLIREELPTIHPCNRIVNLTSGVCISMRIRAYYQRGKRDAIFFGSGVGV